MKAVVWTRYGPPDVLQLQEIEKPMPKDDEVLVKVFAASINSWDWELLKGRAQITLGGRLKPKYRILGCDVAGCVEDVGSRVNHLKPGDPVFGDLSGGKWGGFAEFVCAKAGALAQKSSMMSFEQAAAMPQAAVLALKGLSVKGDLCRNKKVLINGAGGGVGTFAVQLAKSADAVVTGVDRGEKLDMLLSIGADQVIDYEKEDFTRMGIKYDLIIDVVSNHSVFDYGRVLTPKGRCVIIGGSGRAAIGALLLGSWALGSRKVRLLLHKPDPAALINLNELFESGKLKPVIDRCYPLSEVPEAFRYYSKGHAKGKIVIMVK